MPNSAARVRRGSVVHRPRQLHAGLAFDSGDDHETTGGMFDTPTPAGENSSCGDRDNGIPGCSAATFNYTFTGGTSGGGGAIALSRGPVPSGCVQ
jgi:hypothetical protein